MTTAALVPIHPAFTARIGGYLRAAVVGQAESLRWQPADRRDPAGPTYLFCVLRCQSRQVLIFAAVED